MMTLMLCWEYVFISCLVLKNIDVRSTEYLNHVWIRNMECAY